MREGEQEPTQRRRWLLPAIAFVLLPIALYVAVGAWALHGFFESDGFTTVTNGCRSTIHVEVAGKIGSEGFTLAVRDHITVERPHTGEIPVRLNTPVNDVNVPRVSLPGQGDSITLADRTCPA